MKHSKKDGVLPSSRISDSRFASFETDPRFRLPSKKHTRTTIDKRFSRMLKDDDFTSTAKVDRYGRKIKSDTKKKALERLYQPEPEEEDKDDIEEPEQLEVDDDEAVQRELRAADEKYDPARGGGFSSSESESESDAEVGEEDEEDGSAELATVGDLQKLQDEQADVETGEVTNRIAIVNLDWDHIKSADLMALLSSFIPSGSGRIERISIYPSEFGKERMQQEEIEGPPKDLFKGNAREDDSDSEDDSDDDSDEGDERIKQELLQGGDDQDFDSDSLRKYQLDRLRYYYAVMVCSSPATAHKIYEATDGTEYQSSSNFLDLRFVPDEVTFDDEARDECDRIPDSYKPIEFVTNALQSSKVKLTWDMHPEEANRKESIKRAFSGSRAEIEENDLKAYLASDSEDDDEEDGILDEVPVGTAESASALPKLSKKELARKKMREALGLAGEPSSKSTNDGAVGDMEITFAPALTDSKPKESQQEETTIEKYRRKERERKEKKRQRSKAKREGVDPEEGGDDVAETNVEAAGNTGEDLGFDDPFFTAEGPTPTSKASVRKEERRKKREAREAADAEATAQKAHLTKVMAEDADDNQAEHLEHFDMNEIVRAGKQKHKKGKSKKDRVKESAGGLQEDFKMDVGDDRFKAVFDSHEFAIDPSNPKFKATEGMKKLLEEGRRKRKTGDESEGRKAKKMKGKR